VGVYCDRVVSSAPTADRDPFLWSLCKRNYSWSLLTKLLGQLCSVLQCVCVCVCHGWICMETCAKLMMPLNWENRTKQECPCYMTEVKSCSLKVKHVDTFPTAKRQTCEAGSHCQIKSVRNKSKSAVNVIFRRFHHNILKAHKALDKTERRLLLWRGERAEWSWECCHCFCLIFGRQRAPDESGPQAICPPWTPSVSTNTHTHTPHKKNGN